MGWDGMFMWEERSNRGEIRRRVKANAMLEIVLQIAKIRKARQDVGDIRLDGWHGWDGRW